MFFDDNPVLKKKVSLRGVNTGKSDKQNFLERQQQEREKRQLEKIRNKSALTLQSIWKSRKIRLQEATRERNDWDSKVSSAGIENANLLRALLRKLIFFFHSSADIERMDKMAAMILENIKRFGKQPDPNRNFCSVPEDAVPLYFRRLNCLFDSATVAPPN
eukprot:TRINITY_DN6496_c0_g1_i1.p1 TRINITY_DN6496_c0_g1~~TRINITY_DN6496_c0_g1_i1.p1  ORF type:complete len:161 (+),score=17.78 TRINITY_DN6496_c0_g1_i1:154-636(+)